ncbi:hypothetical protein PPERSA_05494 [Pseudocohnilembus persalinus]|uniref:Uncharacterized protein n=1 Tax=Pseudocohnilembus persalinus TaxID=266149 RepID=A0A0V0QD06_PSEPJ|nr:hypothetical protein PPERSA_05494 [Pseudocohnilembus persalinus]|eukprot:KRW99991.1 hypothetical protein PPERSA_05494 [Pseudocohnilembus persalinus]
MSKEALDRKGLALRIVLSSIPMEKLQKLLFQKGEHMKKTIGNNILLKYFKFVYQFKIFQKFREIGPYKQQIQNKLTDKTKTQQIFQSIIILINGLSGKV